MDKSEKIPELGSTSITTEDGSSARTYQTKSFYEKLKVFDKRELQYPNRLKSMIIRPLIFLIFPVISFAGFCYGTNLIWFNVLNGSASLLLANKPYGFSSSIVGLTYLAPLVGLVFG